MAASSQGRFSVMDYPAPRVTLESGVPSLKDSYGAGLGPWDRWAIKWLYGARTDARGGADPRRGAGAGPALRRRQRFPAGRLGQPERRDLWDDFADPVSELRRMMEVRRVALQRFGRAAIPAGESLANLRRAFVPIWLLHRYQVEAAAKTLGGVDFPYALNQEGIEAQAVPGAAQQAALYALLDTLTPGSADACRRTCSC